MSILSREAPTPHTSDPWLGGISARTSGEAYARGDCRCPPPHRGATWGCASCCCCSSVGVITAPDAAAADEAATENVDVEDDAEDEE